MSLLATLRECLRSHDKTLSDILWVGNEEYTISTDSYLKLLAETENYEWNKVSTDLIVVGQDFWIERQNVYSCDEYCEYHSLVDPVENILSVPLQSVVGRWVYRALPVKPQRYETLESLPNMKFMELHRKDKFHIFLDNHKFLNAAWYYFNVVVFTTVSSLFWIGLENLLGKEIWMGSFFTLMLMMVAFSVVSMGAEFIAKKVLIKPKTVNKLVTTLYFLLFGFIFSLFFVIYQSLIYR